MTGEAPCCDHFACRGYRAVTPRCATPAREDGSRPSPSRIAHSSRLGIRRRRRDRCVAPPWCAATPGPPERGRWTSVSYTYLVSGCASDVNRDFAQIPGPRVPGVHRKALRADIGSWLSNLDGGAEAGNIVGIQPWAFSHAPARCQKPRVAASEGAVNPRTAYQDVGNEDVPASRARSGNRCSARAP